MPLKQNALVGWRAGGGINYVKIFFAKTLSDLARNVLYVSEVTPPFLQHEPSYTWRNNKVIQDFSSKIRNSVLWVETKFNSYELYLLMANSWEILVLAKMMSFIDL